jgi:hypothetical protein
VSDESGIHNIDSTQIIDKEKYKVIEYRNMVKWESLPKELHGYTEKKAYEIAKQKKENIIIIDWNGYQCSSEEFIVLYEIKKGIS